MGETSNTPASTDGDLASTGRLPQEGTSTTDGQAPVSQTATTKDPAEYERIIEQLRKENAANRKQFSELKTSHAELAAFKDQTESSQLSEQEKQAQVAKKLQDQLTKLQSDHESTLKELQQTKLAHAVSSVAQGLGFNDPADAMLYIDTSQLDEDYSNVETLLKDVLSKKSWLAAGKPAPLSSGGPTNPTRSQTESGGEITEQYARDVLAGKYPDISKQELARISQWVANTNSRMWSRRR